MKIFMWKVCFIIIKVTKWTFMHIYIQYVFQVCRTFFCLKPFRFNLKTIFHFICYIFTLQLRKKIFMDIEKPVTFSVLKKVIESNITIYCHSINDPFPSYICINFLLIWKFFWTSWTSWLFFLSSLSLCIRNFALYEKK